MSAAPPISVFAENDEPIVGELFSVDRLEQHAESLAAAQVVTTGPDTGKPLIEDVAENGRLLLEYYRAIARTVQQDQAITPAAQWLLENFYIVEEQLREIHDHLPPGFHRKLPKLASGHLAGYPRVYGVAWAFVAHTDSHLDPDVLRRFVTAYQRVQPLSIGELWAVAITLRIVLVENLRRLASSSKPPGAQRSRRAGRSPARHRRTSSRLSRHGPAPIRKKTARSRLRRSVDP